MEVVFEYDPQRADVPANVVAEATNPDVVVSSLRVDDAFATFATHKPEGYEAPRAKLARLRRETAELKAELLEADDDANLVYDVDDLIATLERLAAGLPSRPPPRTVDAVQTAAAVVANVNERANADAPLPSNVELLGGGDATARLLDDAARLGDKLPASLVARLAALKGLHEEGFAFAARLRAAELEQTALRATLQANDDACLRLAAKLKDLDGLAQRLQGT